LRVYRPRHETTCRLNLAPAAGIRSRRRPAHPQRHHHRDRHRVASPRPSQGPSQPGRPQREPGTDRHQQQAGRGRGHFKLSPNARTAIRRGQVNPSTVRPKANRPRYHYVK
jgi:hypothetical protein